MTFCRRGSKGEPGKEALDNPARSPRSEYQSAMLTGAAVAVGVLLHPGRDRHGDAGGDKRDRSDLHQMSVLSLSFV